MPADIYLTKSWKKEVDMHARIKVHEQEQERLAKQKREKEEEEEEEMAKRRKTQKGNDSQGAEWCVVS